MQCYRSIASDRLGNAGLLRLALLGKEEGFAVIFLDPNRVYMSGFSLGSYHTWMTGLTYSNHFAAIAPNALGLFAMDTIIEAALPEGEILPTFYLAGGQSEMELGSSEMTQSALTALWQLNNLGEYAYDEAYEWGVQADSVTTIPYKDNFNLLTAEDARQQYLSISAFVSEDGNTYTWLALNRNKPHAITFNDAPIVWEHIKDFYRDENGKIQKIAEP